MKNRLWILVLLSAVMVLTACGGTIETEEVNAAEIDLAALPATIDVETAAALQDRDDVLLIDVREEWEYNEGHIPGITLIPMNDVASRIDDIPTDKTVVVTCRSGNRSGQVASFLRDQGYDNIINMDGGILAWQQAGLPVE